MVFKNDIYFAAAHKENIGPPEPSYTTDKVCTAILQKSRVEKTSQIYLANTAWHTQTACGAGNYNVIRWRLVSGQTLPASGGATLLGNMMLAENSDIFLNRLDHSYLILLSQSL